MVKVSNSEFKKEEERRRHKEMIDSNKALLAAVKGISIPEQKEVNLEPILTKIESISQSLADKMNQISRPKVVVEKSEINQAEVVSSLKELIKEIKDLKKSISKPSGGYKFNVERNGQGLIQSVNVEQQ